MPNHVTNRLTIIGTNKQVDEVVSKYSTFHERKPRESHDEKFTYEKVGEDYAYGWLDKTTNKFSRRGVEDVSGVPDGYIQSFVDEFTVMPDFNKVIPQPKNIYNGNLGHLKFKGGKETFRNIPEGNSTEAFTMAFEIFPEEGEYYELIDGEYIYKEED